MDFVSKVQIFDNNGLPPLIQLLSSPDPDVKKNSLEIIFNLVQVTHIRHSFIKHYWRLHIVLGEIQMVVVCSYPLFYLCIKDHQSRLAVHELGGIPPLLEQLNSDFPVIQHLVLKTLQSVTIDKDACNTFREEHGVEKLMDILNNTVGVCVWEKRENILCGNMVM